MWWCSVWFHSLWWWAFSYLVVFFLFLIICRCCSSYCLHCFGWPLLVAAHWYSQGCLHVCTYCNHLAFMHCCHWHIQYHSLEPKNNPCPFSILYIQVLQEDRERWLDISWWDNSMHNRWVWMSDLVLLLETWMLFFRCQFWFVPWIFFLCTGTEAMFADLGHFTSASIRVWVLTLHVRMIWLNLQYDWGLQSLQVAMIKHLSHIS